MSGALALRDLHWIEETSREEQMMRGLIAAAASVMLVMGAAPALAQSATKIGQHNAWGTYSYQAANGKVCYVLTVPTDKQPPTLDHGDMFFFVSQRPGQAGVLRAAVHRRLRVPGRLQGRR